MTRIKIIEQLLKGRHLEPKELKAAKLIVWILQVQLLSQIQKETK